MKLRSAETFTIAVCGAEDFAVKVTVTVQFAPTARSVGHELVRANPNEFEDSAGWTVAGAEPLLLTLTVWDKVFPIGRVKFRVLGVIAS